MLTKLRKWILSPIIWGTFFLSAYILELCYLVDEDLTEDTLDVLEEKWWGRDDHKIPHWEKGKSSG